MNENIDIDIEKYVLGNLVSESQLIAQYYTIVRLWKQYGTVD